MKVKDLRKTPLRKLILIINDDSFILDFAKDLILSRIKPERTLTLKGDELTRSLYVRTVSSANLLGGKTAVVIKKADLISKKNLPLIKPLPDVYQVLLSKIPIELEIPKRSYLRAEIDRPSYQGLLDIVIYIFKRKGINIGREEASQIFDLLGRDLMNVKVEVDKVALALGPGNHSLSDIVNVLFPLGKVSLYGLGKLLLKKDKSEFLKRLKSARDAHIPISYVIAVMARELESYSVEDRGALSVFKELLEAEKDVKRGAGWERLYQLVLGT